jgi:hypothetical protein
MTPQQADGSWHAPRSGTCPAGHVLISQTFNDRAGRSGISFTDHKEVFVLGADSSPPGAGLAAAPMGG